MPKQNTPIVSRAAKTDHLRALHAIRLHELHLTLKYFPSPTEAGRQRTVLEIGAGTGHQAKQIQNEGYRVIAIDLPSSPYSSDRVHDITEYDGQNIPMPDASADVIFSSNVLEHIADIDALLEEMRRAMTPEGIAIHVLPSSACRLWSIPAHYAWLLKRLFVLLQGRTRNEKSSNSSRFPRMPGSTSEWIGTLFPLRHGERGNTLTEVYYFSRYWWTRKFLQHGFEIKKIESTQLFYTMSNVMTESISINMRFKLSQFLGSACNIYILRATH